MKLSEQTMLITGGGSGIGLGLAEAFKQLGNQVIVAGRSKAKLEHAKSKGLEILTVDMTSSASITSFAAEAVRQYPGLNCIIHNAGIMLNEKLMGRDNTKTMTDTIQTNLLGPMALNQELIPHLLNQKSAMIMTVTSGLAFMPLSLTPTYCASKAALHSYTESLRYQLHGTSIQVKELVPPYVRTSLMGDRQANDTNAMPLDAFITEVMSILKANPNTDEIVVHNAKPLRDASYAGHEAYKELYKQRNDMFLNARKKEWDAL